MANSINGKSLESWIWDAACSIRGAKDAPKYKDYILPLIFTKRLCDVFDDEVNRIAKEVGSREKAFKLVKHDKKLVRFYLPLEPENPEEPVWSVIRKLSDKIGQQLTTHLRAIADENPLLKGIIDRVDFNATTHGVRDLADDRLSNLIERISEKRLGLPTWSRISSAAVTNTLSASSPRAASPAPASFTRPRKSACIMARIMDPEPGMEIYDPCCGSAGLLIKCQMALEEKMSLRSRGKICAAQALRPGIYRRDLGHGQYEHDHPRHGRADRDRRHLQEPQVPQGQPSPDLRPGGDQSHVEPGLVHGKGLRRRRAGPLSQGRRLSRAARPTGAGCRSCWPA